MKIAIHQPQYMPWIGYFNKIAQSDIFVFLDNVQFKKNEWQHRNRIRNSQNWQWISIPNSYSFPQLITEVKISNNGWQKKHLRSIQICYGKTPFYKEYIHEFKEFYSQAWDTIDKVSIDSIRLILKILGISVKTEVSSSYKFDGQASERLVNICKHFKADTYLAGIGGKGYMDESLFDRSDIDIEYQDFHCPFYKQHWSKTKDDFIPDLSILDLIFNCGPDSLEQLMGKHENSFNTSLQTVSR
jgi:hypothetical protein